MARYFLIKRILHTDASQKHTSITPRFRTQFIAFVEKEIFFERASARLHVEKISAASHAITRFACTRLWKLPREQTKKWKRITKSVSPSLRRDETATCASAGAQP